MCALRQHMDMLRTLPLEPAHLLARRVQLRGYAFGAAQLRLQPTVRCTYLRERGPVSK